VEAARFATEADLDRLDDLAAEAIAEQADLRGGGVLAARESRPLPARPSFEAALASDDHRVIVGTIDDVVIGYAGVHVEDLRNGERLGVVEDIYVEPGARAVGVGEAMIELVLEWCRARDCRGVDGMALPGNRHTKNFFETFGFTARLIVVHRSLLDAGPVTPGGGDPATAAGAGGEGDGA
jgi:GNAT superfamily N-acetyltransferase